MRFSLAMALIFALAALCMTAQGNDSSAARLDAGFGKFPLYFIKNQGQAAEAVSYYVKGSDRLLYFTSTGITFSLSMKGDDKADRWIVKLRFLGARSDVKPEGVDRQKAVYSYFKGSREAWRTNIPTYGKLVYKNLWPGIDLVYSGTVDRLKYEFVVAPGADPSLIRVAYHGASKVALHKSGALEIVTPAGSFEDEVPYAYQRIEGKQKEVVLHYALDAKDSDKIFTYGFEVGEYDPAEPLILDPSLLVYSGFLGGNKTDEVADVAVDGSGCAYLTGNTASDESTFPVKVGPDLTKNGTAYYDDAFVAKVNAQGDGLIYCGYIGGSKQEEGYGIDVDSEGNAYITGRTYTDDGSFPVEVGPVLTYSGNDDAFVAKVSAMGTALLYCGYIGGSYDDKGLGIAVSSEGRAHVVGRTQSTQSTFPVVKGPDLTFNGKDDAFLACVNTAGTGFDFCGYIGGEELDEAIAVAVDSSNDIYMIGVTHSTEWTFPVKMGPDLTKNVGMDAFVAKIGANADIVYCGYIGGNEIDDIGDIIVGMDGSAYVVGWTESDELSFPVKTGPDLTYNGGNVDAFIAKVKMDGSGLDYCGYIGGDGSDSAQAVAVDKQGRAYLGGATSSLHLSFPVKGGPDLIFNGGWNDVFVAVVDETGSDLNYCGYIGGTDSEYCWGIALDDLGCVYVAGNTESDDNSFPVLVGPDLSFNGGSKDAFITKVLYGSLWADTYMLSESGGTVNFSIDAGAVNGNRNYIVLGSVSGTEPGYPLPGGMATLPLNWDPFTDVVVLLINTPIFSDFLGKLDGFGKGSAQINAPPLPPGHAGVRMYYALALNSPFDYVSNVISIDIIGD
ncbi:MAG: DUF7948 domain-containing protein [Planctomycetota bacterium]